MPPFPRSSLLSRLRSRLTFSNVVALIALCIALGGTSYAAAKLPRNSVSSPQVRDGSLRAGDFAKGQLPPGADGANGADGAAGPAGAAGAIGPAGAIGSAGAAGRDGAAGPAGAAGRDGARGATGASGATGAAGSAGAAGATGAAGRDGRDGTSASFAHVGASGAVDAARSQGIAAADVTHPATGHYCLDGLGFTPRNVVANADYEEAGVDEVVQTAVAPTSGPCSGRQAVVYIAISNTDADAGFYVSVN